MIESHNLLLTGASGYLGGILIAYLLKDGLKERGWQVFATVRTPEQTVQVKALGDGIEPLTLDLSNHNQVKQAVVDNNIDIVIHMANAIDFGPPKAFIDGLSSLKGETGKEVHFIHASGAKLFSSHAGVDVDPSEPLFDSFSGLYDLQKRQKAAFPFLQQGIDTNVSILQTGDAAGVRSYVVAPPMVYGPGEGFGNKISIQIVDLVRIGKKTGKMYNFPTTKYNWPLMHIHDQTTLFISLIDRILDGSQIPYGAKCGGYYFAENGTFSWADLSIAIAKRLKSKGFVQDITLATPTDDDLEFIAKNATVWYPKDFIDVAVAGSCALRGDNSRKLGWEPQYDVKHLMSHVDEEVDFILKHDVK